MPIAQIVAYINRLQGMMIYEMYCCKCGFTVFVAMEGLLYPGEETALNLGCETCGSNLFKRIQSKSTYGYPLGGEK